VLVPVTFAAKVRAFGAIVCIGIASTVFAAAGPGGNDICLACHSSGDAASGGGKSIEVDAKTFAKSVHGELGLDCTACHADVSADKIPHPVKPGRVACANCHSQQAKEYANTVHAKARTGGNTVAASCTGCHGQHDIRRSTDPDSRTNHANLEATCSGCHGNTGLLALAKLPGGNIGSQFHDSTHGKTLSGARAADAPTCTNCHGSHSIRTKSDVASRVNRAHIPETCGGCHQAIYARFSKGQHGKLRSEGNTATPVCTDCHTAHQIQRHDLPAFQTAVIEQCANCHGDYVASYRDTFHGQVTKLGYATIATCASCHSAHDMLPESDSASSVSAANRIETCRKCHAGAPANLASFDPHANRHDKDRNPLYWYADKFMDALLIGVFSFFGLHTLLWLARLSIDKFRGSKH
jgi:nitrate/TMAO reductase-like tetraheme cytochrome c subunit